MKFSISASTGKIELIVSRAYAVSMNAWVLSQ